MVLLLILALGGCAGSDEGREPDQPATVSEEAPANEDNVSVLNNPDTAGWTAGLTAKPGAAVATLTAVRTASHDGYERIVFEFADSIPGYRIDYLDPPIHQCGSGDVVEMPGGAWLSIRLEPANAHTEEGQPTVTERNRTLAYENLKALRLICDFEAQVEWIAATVAAQPYRTLELRAPARLVVDIRK